MMSFPKATRFTSTTSPCLPSNTTGRFWKAPQASNNRRRPCRRPILNSRAIGCRWSFRPRREERGDPVMLFQLSINRDGVINGAFQSTLTGDSHPVAGKVDKASQRAAWRVGDNGKTVYQTSLANLTKDVSPLAIHFSATHTQTWLWCACPSQRRWPAAKTSRSPKSSATAQSRKSSSAASRQLFLKP